MILSCSCTNAFQDKEHGPHMRVHNPIKREKDQPQRYRCTVCLNVRTA